MYLMFCVGLLKTAELRRTRSNRAVHFTSRQNSFFIIPIQKRPTETGYQLGISVGIRSSIKGEYSVVLYNENAQAYILEHISEIIVRMNQ